MKLSEPLPGLGNNTWHRWGLRWTPESLTFYYDDVPIWSPAGPISQRSQYIVLSSEIWEAFAGTIPTSGYGSRFSTATKMQVDYVRVYALG